MVSGEDEGGVQLPTASLHSTLFLFLWTGLRERVFLHPLGWSSLN